MNNAALSALATRLRLTLGVPGAAALAAGLLGIVVVASEVPALVRAVGAKAPPSLGVAADDEPRLASFRGSFDKHLAQSSGRSMFFIPPEPPPPPPPPEPEREPEPDPPPSSYGGPAIIAMVGDAVWLADGSRLSLADERARDIEIVSLSPPWGARLKWKGVEFDVPLFDRTTERFLLEEPTATDPTSPDSPGDGPEEEQPAEQPAPDPKPQE